MAKRLTDTDKWKDEWYVSLDNDYKIIWQWLLDNCNHAGICKRSTQIINIMCKTSVTEEEILKKMAGRLIIINNDWFIPNFIKFQYTSLNSEKPVIVSVRNELFKNGYHKLIPESFGNDYLIIKDKDKDKDNTGMGYKKNGKPQKGQKFDDDQTYVIFPNGKKQELGPDQKFMLSKNQLKPGAVIEGHIY